MVRVAKAISALLLLLPASANQLCPDGECPADKADNILLSLKTHVAKHVQVRDHDGKQQETKGDEKKKLSDEEIAKMKAQTEAKKAAKLLEGKQGKTAKKGKLSDQEIATMKAQTEAKKGDGGGEAPAGEGTCSDTVGWANGYSACSSDEIGQEPVNCNEAGWTCSGYVAKSWCADGAVLVDWSDSDQYNHASLNCCACGGGTPACSIQPQWVSGGKSCSNCLNGNTRYNTLEQAWAQCEQVSECGLVMRWTNNKYYLRRNADPDTSAGQSMSFCRGSPPPAPAGLLEDVQHPDKEAKKAGE